VQRFIAIWFVVVLLGVGLAQDPKPGGVYRMLSTYVFSTLDPAVASNLEDWWSSGIVLFSHLYTYDVEGKLVPEVAADMPTVSEDGLVYTIPLNTAVTFSNGRAVTADDVKFTFERVLDPATQSWGAPGLSNIAGAAEFSSGEAEEVSGIRIVDEQTIEFTLVTPQYTFPAVLTSSTYGIVPQQEVLDAGTDWGTKVLISSGPFYLTEFVPGEKMVYAKNPHYYKEGLPYLDGIEIAMNVDKSVAALRRQGGEAEFVPADSLPPAELVAAQSDESYKEALRLAPSGIITTLNFNPVSEPMQNLQVRQAIAHAIDRETLAKRSGRGLLADGFYPSVYPQYDSEFTSAYPYDLEKAKALLTEAGYPDGFDGFAIFAGQGQELGEIIQADLASIGINVEVLSGNWDDYKPRWLSGEIMMTHFGAGGSFLDASELIRGRVTCPTEAAKKANPADAATNWCDPALDEKYQQAETLPLDSEERTKLYREIESTVINDLVWKVVPYHSAALALSQPYMVGDNLHPVYTMPVLEQAWMNK
jgi:oligopeptide transport system substrate-binding protein